MLHLLVSNIDGTKGNWTNVLVNGPTPGQRYGHTLNYKKPLIVLFGGNTSNELKNDTWILSIDKIPLQWQSLKIEGEIPLERVYHSSCMSGGVESEEMIMIFGGRDKELNSHKDLWTLIRQPENVWKWVKNEDAEVGRYQV